MEDEPQPHAPCRRERDHPLTLVLSSGGIDSSTALALALSEGQDVEALFVDYGQAPAAAEDQAAGSVATHYGIERRRLRLEGLSFGSGEIRARNGFLLHVALLAFPRQAGTVVLGIHGGTPYTDCSEPFVDVMRRSFDFHTGGAINVAAPFVAMDKGAVFGIARELGVPVGLTHSCEEGVRPCGVCLSCRDREALLARA